MTLHRTALAPLALSAFATIALATAAFTPVVLAQEPAPKAPLPVEVIAQSMAEDWRRPDPDSLLYLELPSGRVVIELAPQFAPNHVANIRALIRENWFQDVAVVRVQDNYVTQWGRPDELPEKKPRLAQAALKGEFVVPGGAKSLPFARLPDPDTFAPEVGAVGSFPAARDPKTGEAWMTHCYGIVGVGRDVAADSGNGGELYVVIGHSPRALDRNITLVGRVLSGMERLSSLPRGTGRLGFYEDPAQRVPVTAVRLASDLPEAERAAVEVMRSDRPVYLRWVEALRQRKDDFFHLPAGRRDICNALPPARPVK